MLKQQWTNPLLSMIASAIMCIFLSLSQGNKPTEISALSSVEKATIEEVQGDCPEKWTKHVIGTR